MLRVSTKARDRLRRYAVQLTYERDERVSMTQALDELLLRLPLKTDRPKSRTADATA